VRPQRTQLGGRSPGLWHVESDNGKISFYSGKTTFQLCTILGLSALGGKDVSVKAIVAKGLGEASTGLTVLVATLLDNSYEGHNPLKADEELSIFLHNPSGVDGGHNPLEGDIAKQLPTSIQHAAILPGRTDSKLISKLSAKHQHEANQSL
jgi:hypothetical protein